MENYVSFPGFGIEEFALDSVAFSIGNFSVYWYGIIITCGIIFAFLYAAFRGKYEGVIFDNLVDVGLCTVILGVIGARLYYVLTSLDKYIPHPFNLWQFIKNVFDIRGGGLAIYGGIIGGVLGIVIVTRLKKINTLKLLDMAAPGVMIGQLMGRWGNFFNGEAFGGIVNEGHPLYFMRMGLISDNTIRTFGTHEMVYVHPTFLYESLWNLTGFVIINALYKKKSFNGQIACMYLSWYGFGRFFIEGLRTDSLYVGPFRISQVVGLVCLIVFGGLLVLGLVYSRKLDKKQDIDGFDKLLVPSLVEKPVFFANKGMKSDISAFEEKTEAESEENTEKSAENNAENVNERAEEEDNGTDN